MRHSTWDSEAPNQRMVKKSNRRKKSGKMASNKSDFVPKGRLGN